MTKVEILEKVVKLGEEAMGLIEGGGFKEPYSDDAEEIDFQADNAYQALDQLVGDLRTIASVKYTRRQQSKGCK